MKYNVSEKLPDGKYNVLCYTQDNLCIPAYWHEKKQCFFDHYAENKRIENVVAWEYAIVRKRQSADFEELMLQLTLENGDIIAQNSFAQLPEFRQKRLFDELQLVNAAIKMYLRG